MKKTKLEGLPRGVPPEISRLLCGAPVFDSSCSPEARVYYIEKDGGLYLKTAAPKTLLREREMTAYFHKKGIGAEVLAYESGERDFLLTRRVAGEDCTHRMYLDDPARLTDTVAAWLRALHETDFSDCPVPDRTGEYLRGVRQGYRNGQYDGSFCRWGRAYSTAEEAIAIVERGAPHLTSRVLLHGDYCLPNIMLEGWRPTGFIDVGNGGVGDRHIDLFWGAWTLWFNLGTDAYRERFFDAYGRDVIEKDAIDVVAAAEAFG